MSETAASRADPAIRPLTFGDLPQVLEIEQSAFSTPWKWNTFEGLLVRRDTDMIGAADGDELIGYAVCWTVGDQAELGNVAVAHRHRGGGVGRLLVVEALERVRKRGARECFLEVRASNELAQTLYRSMGFEPIGRRKRYYSNPTEDALVMRAELS